MHTRKFSSLQFSRNYSFSSDVSEHKIPDSLERVLARNKAVRKYRHKQGKKHSEQRRVHSVLMEYGEISAHMQGGETGEGGQGIAAGVFTNDESFEKFKFDGKSASELTAFERKLAQAAKEAEREEKAYLEQMSKEEGELMDQMKQVREILFLFFVETYFIVEYCIVLPDL